jgi:hypothetical protein
LEKYKVIWVPTNAGWNVSAAGSGYVTSSPFYLAIATGTTANSKGLVYIYTFGLNSGTIPRRRVDWTKRLELLFVLAKVGNDPESVARIQLKEANTEGILAQKGIGININNYTMTGEAYGTDRGTVSLGNIANDRAVRIKMVKANTEIQFWVDGVLKGTLTGTAVPNVEGTTDACLVMSIINGATGGVDTFIAVGNIIIAQEL